MKKLSSVLSLLIALTFVSCSSGSRSKAEIERSRENEARAALEQLYVHTPGAKRLADGATAILVFPEITKAGFLVGGQYGNGVLLRNGRVAGYYNSTAASYGLQAGVQKFGYALFFMSESDLAYLNRSEGWEIGVGPTVTVADKGFANSITTTTTRKGVYAFFFEQRGLMAGLGIQGTKITKTDTVG